MSSQNRFGYEWQKYHEILPQHEGQFLMWIYPLKPSDFLDKIVLDAGCGMGRNSYWACSYGAKSLTAFDYDTRSVEAASVNLKIFTQAEVLYQDIYNINYLDKFDIVFSIGVIHHLADPKQAILNLYNSLKPGGKMLIWVYGDNLKSKIRLINMVRFFTSKLPIFISHFLTYFLSIPFYLYLKIISQRSEYFKLLKTFSFWHVHAIAFDQLIPDVANYWNKDDLHELMKILPTGGEYIIHPVRGYSWSILIDKSINSHE